MPLDHFSCANCGHWQVWFAGQTPNDCPVCTDTRNALPEDGWDFSATGDIAQRHHTAWQEIESGLWQFSTHPQRGLGSVGWLLVRPDGNVAFEACAHYDEAALAQIKKLGGIRHLAASHPHGYGALWQLQQAFDPHLTVHRADIPYTKAFKVNWPADDEFVIADGLVLQHVGGHYPGQAVLYDAARKALFSGDALKIEMEDGRPTAISCHKAFHYEIPLTNDELAHYTNVFARCDFTMALTPFECARGVTTAHALALFERLRHGHPNTKPVPLSELVPDKERLAS